MAAEFGDLHLVIELVGIAALDASERRFGQGGLDAEDGGGVLLRLSGGHAGEGEDLGDVGEVFLAGLFALGVGFDVVVAVGQAEAASGDFGDDLVGVAGILGGSGVEEEGAASVAVERTEVGNESFAARKLVDGGEFRGEGSCAALVDGFGVHAGGEVVADLLLDGVAVGRLGVLFQDAP